MVKKFFTEDSVANIIGFIVIAAGLYVVHAGIKFDALNFSVWRNFSELSAQFSGDFYVKLARTFIVLAVLFTIGSALKGENPLKFFTAFIFIFILSVFVRLISAQFEFNRYLEWAFFALITGLLVANTIGVPEFLKPAVQTEYYIKTGLVIMGFSVLFSNIVNFGLYGLAIAWIVTPIVIIFMWYFGTRVLKMENDKPFVITIASATSVCGTSAAIATAAASGAKKNDLSLAVSISIIFTIIMMVLEPVIIRAVGLGELMGGALIGGTVDSTGAVTVAGTALGKLGQTTAVLVKSIQNILIGFIAFAVAVFFTTRIENDGTHKASASEIWTRLPKFILGFFAASLIASFIVQPLLGKSAVNSINKVLDQYKNWAFVLAFTSIGLSTNFRELKEQVSGGKPLILYIVGQLFNIVLTFIVVYIALSGKYFPLPNIAL